ncbi:hypothetical protein JTB14_030803 [Gonioctena quinquepunctata]|nr:hypothetical protein JTB14_030803 [Gonioctena quinquepunctata]
MDRSAPDPSNPKKAEQLTEQLTVGKTTKEAETDFGKPKFKNHYQQQGEDLNIQQQERIRGPLTTIRRTVHPKIGLGLRKKKKEGENLNIQQQERIRGPLTTIRRTASPRLVQN